MERLLRNWPTLVFICLPLCIIAVDAAVLVREQLEPDAQRAIRLVRESTSRKQGFTVQQLLYATVYHRKRNGEAINVEGWEAINVEGWHVERSKDAESDFVVQFSYADAAGPHVGVWSVVMENGSITPEDEMATDLSWR